MILTLLLVLLMAGPAPGQPAENASINATTSTNATSNVTAIGTAAPTASIPNLNYIWSFSGIEAGPITMVLNQDAGDLFGQAKFEPDAGVAWNADVVGSITGNEVVMTLTAKKGDSMVTTKLTGTYSNDALGGNFTQISGGKKVGSGAWSAMWINPDTSSYTPAIIPEQKVEAPAPAQENTTATEEDASEETSATKKSTRFVDVHEYKDKIGPGGDLSGVPPGMGGGAL